LYTSPNIIRVIKSRRMRWEEHIARIGAMRNEYNIGRPRYRWKDNIRMDLWKIRWEGVEWMHLAQNGDQWREIVNTVMKRLVP